MNYLVSFLKPHVYVRIKKMQDRIENINPKRRTVLDKMEERPRSAGQLKLKTDLEADGYLKKKLIRASR